MRLPRPFYRLGLRFDFGRIREEIEKLPAALWADHPNEIAGNSSLRLISVDGGENDAVNGPMMMTAHLRQSRYIRQVLASFGVVWGRSRPMRLAPGASVPLHADINYHWFSRVRMHIPVITHPGVRFYCGDQSVHMAAGEAWLFDNWRQHHVENPTDQERIHLVADTSGSSSFWQLVAQSQNPDAVDRVHQFDPQRDATPLTEKTILAPVMPPAEVDLLLSDLRSECVGARKTSELDGRVARYQRMLDNFCKDWRQLYALHGESESGRAEFVKLRDSVREASKELSEDIVIHTNRVSAHAVLEGRVLRPMLTFDAAVSNGHKTSPAAPTPLRRPVFIVAAPRSGSTLLFETLAASEQLITVGGEAHWLVEEIEELRAGWPGIESNRLSADACSAGVAHRMQSMIADRLVDCVGRAVKTLAGRRFLEKTPKNSLRIPFFNRVFPDAQFIFLWRDPRQSLSSIIEAWRSSNWKTYNGLDGFEGPWSLILPPGWRTQNGRPLEEIAAFQWDITNRIVLDDLKLLPSDRWVAVSYEEIIAAPRAAIERLCRFIGIDVDPTLRARVSAPLPLSRFTQTPPAVNKWRSNAVLIERVLPGIESTWQRLQALR